MAAAKEPLRGNYQGRAEYEIAKAEKKRSKLKAKAAAEATGGPEDLLLKVDASEGGQKVEIQADFKADGTLTVSANGRYFAGTVNGSPKAVGGGTVTPKTVKYRGSFKGTSVYVGPFLYEFELEGKVGNSPTKVKGSMDLDSSGGLILDLDLKSSKTSPLGAKSSFGFKGKRTS